jgi:hypothetical protein
MTMGHQLGLRLFIEGIETPVIGASISIAPSSPAAASIQVIATDRVLELYPRTVIHLFFYDYVEAGAYIHGGTQDPDVLGGYESEAYLNSRYKLLFCGELHGIQFSKNINSRAVVLQCVDFSNYWDTTYQYNFNGELLSGHFKAAFLGANTNLFTSPLGHGVGTVASLLSARCVSFPYLEGLLAGIVHVLEAIGGAYYGNNTFKGCNDFCSIAELRVKLLQQVCAAERDTSTKNLFARKAFNMWMNRQVGSLGQLVTFRSLAQVLMKFIFHECFPNPAAYYKPKIENLKKKQAFTLGLDKDPRTAELYKDATAMLTLARNAEEHIVQFLGTGGENSPGGRGLTLTLQDDYINLVDYSRLLNVSKARRTLPAISGLLSKISGSLQKSAQQLCTPGANYKIDVNKAVQTTYNKPAQDNMQEVITALETLLGMRTNHSREVTYDEVDRLNNQIFRPDIWFVPPPVCNVLFPESYSQFQWSRNYLREVSRLELQTTNEVLGDDALFNGRYYAPNVADMRKGVKMESRRFSHFIMQHELFTGIIPMFEKLTEANLFAMRSTSVQMKAAKVGYAQRAVNFQYFKHRFASRQMAASGRFNPWFVAGFPALLIDKCMSYDNLAVSGLAIEEQLLYLDIVPKGEKPTRAEVLRELIPTQYLGHCVSLSHDVNQQGGSTQYGFTEARLHRESSEFLGVDRAVVSRKIGIGRKTGVYAIPGMQVPKEGSRGPRGGVLKTVENVTRQYSGRVIQTLSGSPAYTVIGDPVDVDYYLKTYEQDMSASHNAVPTTSIKQLDQYKAYRLTEEFTKRIREEVDLPIEDAVRPPWIWDGWHNLKIGETYLQLFGCDAIVDVEKVTSADLIGDVTGADSYNAVVEAKEGLSWGSWKAESPESSDAFLDRLSGVQPKTRTKTKAGTKTKSNKPEPSPEPGRTAGMKLSADRKAQGLTLITLDKEKTIEGSVDYLVRLYSMLKLLNLDVESFLRNYNWRPIATMVEILGSANLEITKKPDKLVRVKDKKSFIGATKIPLYTPVYKTVEQGYEVKGTEGFHSRAFSDESNLFGLVDAKVTKVLGIDVKNQALSKKLDIRGLRRQVVRDYVEELTNSRGLLG